MSGSQCRGTDGNERVMSLMESKELCQVVNGHGTDRNYRVVSLMETKELCHVVKVHGTDGN